MCVSVFAVLFITRLCSVKYHAEYCLTSLGQLRMSEKITSQLINETAIWDQIRNTVETQLNSLLPLMKYKMRKVASEQMNFVFSPRLRLLKSKCVSAPTQSSLPLSSLAKPPMPEPSFYTSAFGQKLFCPYPHPFHPLRIFRPPRPTRRVLPLESFLLHLGEKSFLQGLGL